MDNKHIAAEKTTFKVLHVKSLNKLYTDNRLKNKT